MSFLTTVLRRSGGHWVAICLENGVVSQGSTKEDALERLRDAAASLELALSEDESILSEPIAIRELHEFLSVGSSEPASETYEFKAVNA